MSKKKFMLVITGDEPDETDVVFVEAESKRATLLYYLECVEGFDLKESFDQLVIEEMLRDNPLGVAEIDTKKIKLIEAIEWFNELPDVQDPVE